MRRMIHVVSGWLGGLVVGISLLCAGCIPSPTPLEIRYPAIVVSVIDSVTGYGVYNVTITASDGESVEVLCDGESGDVCWGIYRAGNFNLNVTAEGYEPAVVSGIWIPAGRYLGQDYVPVNVVVRLTPVGQDADPAGQ